MPPPTTFTIQQKRFKSFDGTSIGYQVIGRGKRDIVLCNGLGGSATAWEPLYERFGKDYRFITWDYRGLFKSDPPQDPANMDVASHAKDLHFLLAKEKIKKALIGGWSMGIQVGLEYYRLQPKAFEALFLINGTCGQPFRTVMNSPLSRYILPVVNDLAKRLMPAVQPTLKPLANRVIDWEMFLKIVVNLGLVHENLHSKTFNKVAKEMVNTDLVYYHSIMEHLSQHDASDVLPSIKVPTLIIAGTNDIITPVKVAERMASLCPKAELFIVPHGTHYTLLEFSKEVNLRLAHFLEENYPH